MNNFTETQRKNLMDEATEILKSIAEGKEVRDILAEIYVKELEDKTMNQGYVMADAILESVENFDADYKEAQKSIEKYINKFQKKAEEGKTITESCNYWRKFIACLSEEEYDSEIKEEDATEEYLKELRNKARELLLDSDIMLSGLISESDQLIELTDGEELAAMLTDLGSKEIEYRAIVSMLAYTKTKRGEFENIPVQMTLEQITVLVCSEIERIKILEAVGKGEMAETIVELLLYVLGIVALIRIAIPVAIALAGVIGAVTPILAVPAVIMAVCGITHIFHIALEQWGKDTHTVIKKTSALIHTVAEGAKLMANYLVSTAKKGINKIKEKIRKSEEETTVEETVNDEEEEIIETDDFVMA